MPFVTIPGVGRVNFPAEMSVEEMEAAALKLSGGVGREPNTGKYDERQADLDRFMTPGSIARTAARDGLTMAGAEIGGLGIGAVANRLIAPRLTFLDPAKPAREAATTYAGKVTAQVRSLAENVAKAVKRQVGDDPALFLAAVAKDQRLVGQLDRVLTNKQFQRFVRFAKSPLGMEAAEALAVPAATMIGGPVGGLLAMGIKSVISPGPTVRYLTRSQLPSAPVRTIGRQGVTTGIRGLLSIEDEDENR